MVTDPTAAATKQDIQMVLTQLRQMRGDMATKGDFAMLKKNMDTMRESMATKEDITMVRQDMATKQDITMLKDEMQMVLYYAKNFESTMATKEDLQQSCWCTWKICAKTSSMRTKTTWKT